MLTETWQLILGSDKDAAPVIALIDQLDEEEAPANDNVDCSDLGPLSSDDEEIFDFQLMKGGGNN